MRMLMRWRLGTKETKEAIRSGRMAEINKTLDELTKPETQYFCTEGGTRTGYIFFDLADPSDIPSIAEPLFQELNATVEFFPVMNGQDLGAGLTKASSAWTCTTTPEGAVTSSVATVPTALETFWLHGGARPSGVTVFPMARLLANEAETGLDVVRLRRRLAGRPMGSGPAENLPLLLGTAQGSGRTSSSGTEDRF